MSDVELRAFRGALVGIYLDALKPRCPEDPVTHIRCVADNGVSPKGLVDGVLFTANYRLYTTAQRKAMRDAYKARGYRHWPISLFCPDRREYHGVFPPCKASAKVGINDALRELWDDGLIPVGFLLGDREPDDLATPIQALADGLDPSLVRIISPYWEHVQVDCAIQKTRAAFPNALIYWHNPLNADAGSPDACYPYDSDADKAARARRWWQHARETYHLTGILLQVGDELGDAIGRMTAFTARFGAGYRGWPTGLDTVLFEDTANVYNVFWSGGSESQALRRASQYLGYLSAPLCEEDACGHLAGFCSGGRP